MWTRSEPQCFFNIPFHLLERHCFVITPLIVLTTLALVVLQPDQLS